ncbi:LuxR family transcriptional regulator [Kitasatospora herbaricolor]|uniref:ATP-binding protein n=1 Tax=Kitasatospora herbaricolor TaxID=68217 RepID=UPI00174EBB42|nr:LuxR C-terminal-related transcriptional regulator [Kitasatospora herbaricolor]MDQ0306790.1 non-specific serine/threonine protein kinase [Kitasatospora herbaricolor]GGV50568.1 LuxR family transcriptional regulator [Kitasatospora herbaricolor]
MGESERRSRGAANAGLPAELTSFVGRRREIAEVRGLLSTARVVTLLGPGGIGKTRLALRVADQVRRAFTEGVAFVDLAPVRDADLLAYTVSDALNIASRSPHDQVDVITDFLRDRQTLLVLDNCEHLVDACADLVNTVLRAAPDVRVLATSRQRLGVTGERLWQVPPLAVPDPDRTGQPAAVPESEALALFAARAATVSDFVLTEDNWPEVSRLCRRMDGLPLAIELAAAGTRVLSPGDILERLDGRVRILASTDRGAPSRHRTLGAVVDGSYDLCSPQERLLWSRMSVFARGFTLPAAEQVCSDESIPPDTVLDLVTGLVDKSILIPERHPTEIHYRLLDTLARYGRDRLREAGEEDAVRRRHRDFYAAMSTRFSTEWFGPGQVEQARRMRAEHANLRAALDHCLTTPGEGRAGLVMATDLIHYWVACGHITEGRHWLERALALNPQPTPERASGLRRLGSIAARQGDAATAVPALEECRAIARRLGDGVLDAEAMAMLGQAAITAGDPEAGLPYLQESAERLRRLHHPPEQYIYLPLLVALAKLQLGAFDQAAVAAEEACRLCSRSGDRWYLAAALLHIGYAEIGRGNPAAAAAYAVRAMDIAHDFDDPTTVGLALLCLAYTAMATGDHRRGAVLTGICRGIWQQAGMSLGIAALFSPTMQPLEAAASAELGETEFRGAVAYGTGLDLDQAVAFAHGADSAAMDRPGRSDSPLTRRERQVADLVAEGLSNKQIAADLVISQRTAEGHIEHILTKLGFSSRTQIAAWVVRTANTVQHPPARHQRASPPPAAGTPLPPGQHT